MIGGMGETAPYVIGAGNEVVFVDDCEGDLELAQICYEECGATNQLLTFSGSAAFMEFLRTKKAKRHPQPEVIFLDINMPGEDGFEVLAQLKQDPYFQAVPVVFILSNSDNPNDMDNARRLGATDYLVKPTSPRAFVGILRKVLS